MNLTKLIVALAVPQLVGFLGSLVTTPSITTWYATINQPSFTPPNFVFAPVWTLLFLLMGYASYLILMVKAKAKKVKAALAFYAFQLVANFFWSYLFFGLKRPDLALVEIIILWLLILVTLVKFYRLSQTAGLLLLPYLAWVSFAAYLNLSIVQLNF